MELSEWSRLIAVDCYHKDGCLPSCVIRTHEIEIGGFETA